MRTMQTRNNMPRADESKLPLRSFGPCTGVGGEAHSSGSALLVPFMRGTLLDEDRVADPGLIEDPVAAIGDRPVVEELESLAVLRNSTREPRLLQTDALPWPLGNFVGREHRDPGRQVPSVPRAVRAVSSPSITTA